MIRLDGLVNFLTGINTPRDKNYYDLIYPDRILSLSEIENLYRNYYLVKYYIELIVEDSLSKAIELDLGFISQAQKEKLRPIVDKEAKRLRMQMSAGTLKKYQIKLLGINPIDVMSNGSINPKVLERLSFIIILKSAIMRALWDDEYFKDENNNPVSFFEVLREALFESRLYGGSLIVLGLNDGKLQSQAVDEQSIKSIGWIQTLDRYCVSPYLDGSQSSISNPELYQIHNPNAPDVLVHSSRVIRIDAGSRLTRRQRLGNNGWMDSCLQPAYKEILRFQKGMNVLGAMFEDSQTINHGIKGLFEMLDDPNSKNDVEALREKLRISDMTRSVTRREVYDLDREKIEIVTRDFSSLIEAIKLCLDVVVSAVRLPHTFLLGKSPTGPLSSSGKSENLDIERTMSDFQTSYVRKPISRILRLIQLAKNGPTLGELLPDLTFSFPSLYPLTRKEEAELMSTQASAYSMYIQMGVLQPDEVALALFGGPKPQPVVLDWEAREKAKQEAERQAEEKDSFSSNDKELLGLLDEIPPAE